MKYQFLSILGVFIFLALISCDSRPKVIESQSNTSNVHDHEHPSDSPGVTDELVDREVVVNEILHTSKYSYLNVTEKEEKFWIAIPKSEVEIGDVYFFKGGLLKKNFKSQEFDRVFETVYLVSNYWKKAVPGEKNASTENMPKTNDPPITEVGNIERAAGSVPISELIGNKEKYNGKLVQITGKCTKVNNMIMGRNWVHMQDESGEKFDLTVTTTEVINLGSVVTLEGTIILDKDFGAGYRYDILMEGAVLK
jgi:hypothetical protein